MARQTTIDDRIRAAGWFDGTEREWQALSHAERSARSFAATGCEVAYPTWPAPVECCHRGCQIARGEKLPLSLTNMILRSEIERGWLRFSKESTEGRLQLARTVRAIRRRALESGVYDPWQMRGGWQAIVGTGVSSML